MRKTLALSALIGSMALSAPALAAPAHADAGAPGTAARAASASADIGVLARGTTGSVSTKDKGIKGGTGLFWHDGNGAQPKNKSVIGVRDNQGDDGKWVWIELTKVRKGPDLIIASMENKSGKSRNVKTKVVKVKDGSKVVLKVCLSTKEGLLDSTCNKKTFIA
ncbi:hypothetical protein [Actinomadura fibrosa]|uniref:Secreted protein n=1 Tax=Actinomadura fibrosa TaxID=111802 RepID=A0ABW2XI63_9ACTN|nr:hypothetical protein [Actinomadura fibrosa]